MATPNAGLYVRQLDRGWNTSLDQRRAHLHTDRRAHAGGVVRGRELHVTVTANPAGGGTIAEAGTFPYNSLVTLTATPSTGYRFVNWTEAGTQVSTSAAYTFTLTRARTLVANFAPLFFTVTIVGGGNGSGTVTFNGLPSPCVGTNGVAAGSGCQESFEYGLWADLSAAPAAREASSLRISRWARRSSQSD